jgi:hypothetical protein
VLVPIHLESIILSQQHQSIYGRSHDGWGCSHAVAFEISNNGLHSLYNDCYVLLELTQTQLHPLLHTFTSSINMISALLFLLPALAAASPLNSAYTPLERRDAGPPIDQITIESSSYSGNGCPQGSVSTTLSPDKTVSRNSNLSQYWSLTQSSLLPLGSINSVRLTLVCLERPYS